jgi:protein-S-isoprenylcysteine O-methyltransferase Ste14
MRITSTHFASGIGRCNHHAFLTRELRPDDRRYGLFAYTRDMTLSYQIIAGCWAIFFLFWIISALFVKPTDERPTSSTSILVRTALSTGIFLLLLTRRGSALHLSALPQTALRSALGNVLCVLGLFLALWARVTLGRNWSASVTFKKDHELIRTGPYALMRHPIYTAVLLMIIGTMIFIGRIEGIILIAVAIAGFWIKLRAEERLMTTHFPTEYPVYKSQTKALVPFVF